MAYAKATIEIFFEYDETKPIPTAGAAIGPPIEIARKLGVKLCGEFIKVVEGAEC